MCYLCFERKTTDQLNADPESGQKENVCLECARMEQARTGKGPDPQTMSTPKPTDQFQFRISRQELDTVRAALQWWGTFTSVNPMDLAAHVEAEGMSQISGEPLHGPEIIDLREKLDRTAVQLTQYTDVVFRHIGADFCVDEAVLKALPADWRIYLWDPGRHTVNTGTPSAFLYMRLNQGSVEHLTEQTINTSRELKQDLPPDARPGWWARKDAVDPGRIFDAFYGAFEYALPGHIRRLVCDAPTLLQHLAELPKAWFESCALAALVEWKILKRISP